MKYLGIDQSYTGSGICVIDNDGVTITHFEKIKTISIDNIYNRALDIALKVSNIVTIHKISSVRLEGLAFGMRGNATRDLAGLLFTIFNVLTINHPKISRIVVPPTSLKKFATGSGKSDKAAMIAALPSNVRESFLQARYKKTTGLADLADAYWLARFPS